MSKRDAYQKAKGADESKKLLLRKWFRATIEKKAFFPNGETRSCNGLTFDVTTEIVIGV